jgi:tagaturonate reductase
MTLSRYTLKNINNNLITVPDELLFELPEKVVQFGTGALLRGLPDYYIDKANRQGIFNGRIVAVKSTTQGDVATFNKQDSLYTLCVRGIEGTGKSETNIISSSISRVLSAAGQWEEVLECAHNHQLQIIISNTTEVGIRLINEDVRNHPPKSFPGKLLAFLYERFKAFGGSELSGMVIIPTELIPDNGKKLESIVLELAHLNGLEDEFIEWIEKYNCFCNSLVDRIVPGKPEAEFHILLEEQLGYADNLVTIAEPYSLWAIEGDEKIKNILSFAHADEAVIVQPDIEIFRELKLRLLNGTHTLASGLAFISGCQTVKQAMDNETIASFITELMQNEIAPFIPCQVSLIAARSFGKQVLERFRNPHIRHQWINITMQYSSKMKLRCIPILLKHYELNKTVPELFALGFAAYLRFTKPVSKNGEQYYGERNGETYLIQDDMAEVFYKRWATLEVPSLVLNVLSDVDYWGEDLSELPGFAQSVTEKLTAIIHNDIKGIIESVVSKKVIAA